jgi:hypothetical protein
MSALWALFADRLFWCGLVGAAGVEVITLYNAARRGQRPKRVRSPWFWCLFTAVCFLGGWLAARVLPSNPELIATMAGASVTLAFQKFSRNTPP